MKNTIELTIPRTPGREMMPFCHRCMRAVDTVEVEHDVRPVWNPLGYVERHEHTGGMSVAVKCHGEEWHAHLRGDGTWAIRAVA
jgi:hypothetical protein